MTSRRRQLALLIHGLEARITELEQERPPDAPVRRVMNVAEDGTQSDDTVSTTKKTDFQFKYDVSGNGYDESEWA